MPGKVPKRSSVNGVGRSVCCVLILAGFMPAAMSQAISHETNETTEVHISSPVQSIVDALSSAGISVEQGQIEILSGAVNLREGASVRVVKMTDAAAGTVRVKLRCQDNHECLPFYVLVHGVDAVNVRSAAKVRGMALDTLPVIRPGPPPNVVRGGDHAILVLETPDSRMSFPVICLQNGARGQKVRVTSPDHARIYEAEVVGAGLLKGNL
jgi:flagella basal body P-ring formation protein FlgA